MSDIINLEEKDEKVFVFSEITLDILVKIAQIFGWEFAESLE